MESSAFDESLRYCIKITRLMNVCGRPSMATTSVGVKSGLNRFSPGRAGLTQVLPSGSRLYCLAQMWV